MRIIKPPCTISRVKRIKPPRRVNYQVKWHRTLLQFIGGGRRKIKIAMMDENGRWTTTRKAIIKPRKGYFDDRILHIADVVKISEGILLLYYVKKPFALGAALFDLANPQQLIWRSAEPIWTTSEKMVEPIKAGCHNRIIKVYLNICRHVEALTFSLDYLFKAKKKVHSILEKIEAPELQRAPKNPILSPREGSCWECSATFNTAALCLDGKVHFIYRAIGQQGASVLGYAASQDGLHIDERSDHPVYLPSRPFEYRYEDCLTPIFPYCSGGGWGGCEDPRLVQIDDRIYMIYTAFNGCEPPGVAFTSITVENFRRKNWQWKEPILISPRGEIHKNWVLFPRKINGKYAILHSISPKILIAYLDDLDFKHGGCIHSEYKPRRSEDAYWDAVMRGVGPPPIETPDGWLVFYHAMDKEESHRYKLGAMILDKEDPSRILYRSAKPLLAPDASYENEGYKPHVIYSCGAVVKNGKLIVYYGGADTVICAASADFDRFLKQLKGAQLPMQGVAISPVGHRRNF